jgi:glycosyltransferase involved in cell wall biosynthesis
MISVLLATRNPNPTYFKEAVLSVLNQTYKDIELLIGFNDCEIIIPKIEDSRIRIFKYKEAGKGRTLNKLLKEAKGDYIAIQDDDDIWMLNKLEIQLPYLDDSDVVGSMIEYINEDGEDLGMPKLFISNNDIVEKSNRGINQIANTSALIRREVLNGWNEEIDGIEDFDLWLSLMKKNCTFINVTNILVHHRIHDKSNFNTKTHDIKGLLKKYGL